MLKKNKDPKKRKVREHQKLSFLYEPANDYFMYFVHVTIAPNNSIVSHIEAIRRHSQYKSSLNLVF